VLGNIAPPIIGPVLAEFYVIQRAQAKQFADLPEGVFHLPALIAFVFGAAITFLSPSFVLPSLFGLFVSFAPYLVLRVWLSRKRDQAT
jgi:purine-cytosine permease-like protein